MKIKPKHGKKGRKKFSASKEIAPERSIQENLNLAAIGEFAIDPEGREIFDLVACWNGDYATP